MVTEYQQPDSAGRPAWESNALLTVVQALGVTGLTL
jgi:hypothetical protein